MPSDLLLVLSSPALRATGGRRYRLRRVTPLDRVAWPAALGVGLVSLLEVPLKFAFGRTGPETFYHDNPSLPSDNVYGFHPFLKEVSPTARFLPATPPWRRRSRR